MLDEGEGEENAPRISDQSAVWRRRTKQPSKEAEATPGWAGVPGQGKKPQGMRICASGCPWGAGFCSHLYRLQRGTTPLKSMELDGCKAEGLRALLRQLTHFPMAMILLR